MRGISSRIGFAILGSTVLAVLAGCAGGPSGVTRRNFVEFSSEQKQEIETNSSREYQIQEGDKLRIAFAYEKELTQDGVVVLPDGSISLVGVDRLEVAGRTLSQADSLITAAYARDYIEPNLSVIIQETRGRRVYVLGEVRNPGMHMLPTGGIDILGAITVAGGFTENASKSGTVLVRVTGEGYLVQEVNLDGFASLASAGLATLQVQPYDVVYVPRSRIGDFAFFSRTVIAGIAQLTRIATDIRYLSSDNFLRN